MGDRGAASGKAGAAGGSYQEVNDDSIFDESVDKWKNDITNSEYSSTEKYTGSAYYEWNDDLRKGNENDWKQDTAALDKSLSKFNLEQNIVTYRGFDSDAAEAMFGSRYISAQEINSGWVGAVVSDKAFLSTSISKSVANDFSGSYIFKINVPKGKGRGAYVDSVSMHRGEKEFLMPRNTKLKITGAQYSSSTGKTVILVDYVK